MTLTTRDLDLLETLTCRVSLLGTAQAVALAWPSTRRQGTARGRLSRLARAGWIRLRTVNAHPPLPVIEPLCAWQPGDEDPDYSRIARKAQQRWSQAARPTEICFADKRCASLFGSTAACRLTGSHVDHDLRLSAVYVHYRRQCPTLASLWIGEHALPKAGYQIKDPDAFLRDQQGRVLRVIESAGRYSATQVERFHEHCADNQFPYELW
jgi:hypothetical protein